MITKDSTYWARTFANTLANEVSTVVALSDLTFNQIAKEAGITDSDVRSIRNLDVELPIGTWMRYVQAAAPHAAREYFLATPGRDSVHFTDAVNEINRDWLSGLASRMKDAVATENDQSGAMQMTLNRLLAEGDKASFKEWSVLAMNMGVGHGLDASHLAIVPKDTTNAIQSIWDESLR